MNNAKNTHEGDVELSRILREEYAKVGATVRDLQSHLGCGRTHARSLWRGEVVWKLDDTFDAISLPALAAAVPFDDRLGFIARAWSPEGSMREARQKLMASDRG